MKQTVGYKLIGLMSGTSLDGVDVALCSFSRNKGKWQFNLLYSSTIPYTSSWRIALENAHLISEKELADLDKEYGEYLGLLVNTAIENTGIRPDFVASHGHTVFHNPNEGYTLQIGSGEKISLKTGLPVICDFRSLDISKGGQGAPLVPVGDKLLFSDYAACLNLGGFSNISFDYKNERVAYDICPVNIILNSFALKMGKEYDENGLFGQEGKINLDLLRELNSLLYYRNEPPKSLSREWLEENILPILESCGLDDSTKLATLYYHIADQIAANLNQYKLKNVLITGGGTLNKYLIELIVERTDCQIKIPDRNLIEYKEAIIFAFLGLLRYLGVTNCYASVTGASEDSVCGTLYS